MENENEVEPVAEPESDFPPIWNGELFTWENYPQMGYDTQAERDIDFD